MARDRDGVDAASDLDFPIERQVDLDAGVRALPRAEPARHPTGHRGHRLGRSRATLRYHAIARAERHS